MIKKLLFFSLLFSLKNNIVGKSKPDDTKNIDKGSYHQSDEQQKTIWLHANDIGDLLAAERFIYNLKRHSEKNLNYEDITITTNNIETKISSDTIIPDHPSYVVPYDDLNIMLSFFKKINPSMIFFISQDFVCKSLMLLAILKDIPLYLFDGRASNYTIRFLESDPFYALPFFNSFNHILVKMPQEIEKLKQYGINKPTLKELGNINALDMIQKKVDYLDQLEATEEEIQEKFDYPILLVNPLYKNNVDFYIKIFEYARQRHPQLKMIIALRQSIQWSKSRLDQINSLGYKYFILNENLNTFQNKTLLFNSFKFIVENHDIIVTSRYESIFYLQAIATLYFVDGTPLEIKNHNFIEAAIWNTPIIIGPIEQRKRSSESKNSVNLKKYTDIDDSYYPLHIEENILKEIVIIQARNEREVINKTLMLLDDEELCRTMGEHSYFGVEDMSEYVENNLLKFYKKINILS